MGPTHLHVVHPGAFAGVVQVPGPVVQLLPQGLDLQLEALQPLQPPVQQLQLPLMQVADLAQLELWAGAQKVWY